MAALTGAAAGTAIALWLYSRRGEHDEDGFNEVVTHRNAHSAPKSFKEDLYFFAEGLRYTYSETLGRWRTADLLIGLAYLCRRDPEEHVAADISRAGVPYGVGADAEAAREGLRELRTVERAFRYCVGMRERRPEVQAEYFRRALGVDESAVLARSHKAGVLKPSFVLVRDDAQRSISLIVRGTHSFRDLFTSLTGASKPHHLADSHGVVLGYAHFGMLAAARWLKAEVTESMGEAVLNNPGYRPLLIGHSLGAGTAAILTMMLRESPGPLDTATCIAIACPACMTQELAKSCAGYVTTIVNGADVIPTVSPGSADALRASVTTSAWSHDLRADARNLRVVRAVEAASRNAAAAARQARAWTGARIASCVPPKRGGGKDGGGATAAAGVAAGKKKGAGVERKGGRSRPASAGAAATAPGRRAAARPGTPSSSAPSRRARGESAPGAAASRASSTQGGPKPPSPVGPGEPAGADATGRAPSRGLKRRTGASGPAPDLTAEAPAPADAAAPGLPDGVEGIVPLTPSRPTAGAGRDPARTPLGRLRVSLERRSAAVSQWWQARGIDRRVAGESDESDEEREGLDEGDDDELERLASLADGEVRRGAAAATAATADQPRRDGFSPRGGGRGSGSRIEGGDDQGDEDASDADSDSSPSSPRAESWMRSRMSQVQRAVRVAESEERLAAAAGGLPPGAPASPPVPSVIALGDYGRRRGDTLSPRQQDARWRRTMYPAGRIMHLVPASLLPWAEGSWEHVGAAGGDPATRDGDAGGGGTDSLGGLDVDVDVDEGWSSIPVRPAPGVGGLGGAVSESSSELSLGDIFDGEFGDGLAADAAMLDERRRRRRRDSGPDGPPVPERSGRSAPAPERSGPSTSGTERSAWSSSTVKLVRLERDAAPAGAAAAGAATPAGAPDPARGGLRFPARRGARAAPPPPPREPHILLDHVPQTAYGRIKLCRNVLSDHIIPSYLANLESAYTFLPPAFQGLLEEERAERERQREEKARVAGEVGGTGEEEATGRAAGEGDGVAAPHSGPLPSPFPLAGSRPPPLSTAGPPPAPATPPPPPPGTRLPAAAAPMAPTASAPASPRLVVPPPAASATAVPPPPAPALTPPPSPRQGNPARRRASPQADPVLAKEAPCETGATLGLSTPSRRGRIDAAP